MQDRLQDLGWSEKIKKQAAEYCEFRLGRVIAQYKGIYRVATEASEVYAEISGRLRYLADDNATFPAVGDFVLMDRDNDEAGHAIIHMILPRHSAFIRKAAGTAHEVQVVAANIDVVFICMSLNRDFNLRRLERYLAVAWESGSTPVIVLTKADLCRDTEQKLKEIETVALGVECLVTSSMSDDGYETIKKYIKSGNTVAFIGSSGVGKSTLINRLLGQDRIMTQEIRQDDRGRHTTTGRELIIIPSGGAVIDTPGMRELGLESADLENAFGDIETLARSCRFRDCTHQREPGCAVREAIEAGSITEQRLMSYTKLRKEAQYEGLNSRQIEQEKIQRMFAEFGGIKNARDFAKSKNYKR
ncbi:MAG: ribosome small subunit-dependent GTPase A [Syntrophomonadaceae bacterium]